MYVVLSHFQLFATLWTVAHQAPLSIGFSRQKHWNGWPGDIPDPGIEPVSLACPELALACIFFTPVPPGKPFS